MKLTLALTHTHTYTKLTQIHTQSHIRCTYTQAYIPSSGEIVEQGDISHTETRRNQIDAGSHRRKGESG